jgi:hypothetical protein
MLQLLSCELLLSVRTAPNPDHRMTAQECLDKLNERRAIDAPALSVAASFPVPEAPHFDRLVHFVDTFCASGFTRVKYDVQLLNAGDDLEVEVIDRDGFPVIDIKTDSYNAAKRSWMPGKMKFRRCVTQNREWLFVRQGSQRYEGPPDESESSRVQRVKSICNDVCECLKPDYFVCPRGSPTRAGFFLPLNMFSIGLKGVEGLLDVDCLEFVAQSGWFTVFRYTSHDFPNGIMIKHTSINNATFQYLVQEKAMLGYLNASDRVALEKLEGGFSPLIIWKINEDLHYQNDRFIVYEDGGRPLDVQFFHELSPQPTSDDMLHIARDLLEALVYLFDKHVVHRNLNLGTVVYRRTLEGVRGGAKLIALGHAKFIVKPLPHEERIEEFERCYRDDDLRCMADGFALDEATSPKAPLTTFTNSDEFDHPEAKCVDFSIVCYVE